MDNDDEPIKGHKVKPGTFITERYFGQLTNTTSEKENQTLNTNSKQFHLTIETKDETKKDTSSNKSNDKEKQNNLLNKQDLNEKYMKRFSHLYSPLSSKNSSFNDDVELENRLKAIQKKLLGEDNNTNTNTKPNKLNYLIDNQQTSLDASDQTLNNQQSNKYSISETTSTMPTDASKLNQNRKFETQNQLRFYIQSLEKKLATLRNEMKDTSMLKTFNSDANSSKLVAKEILMKKKLTTATSANGSNDSIDSMKEISNFNNDIKSIYNKKREAKLNENKNHNNNNNNNNSSNSEEKDDDEDDDDERNMLKKLHAQNDKFMSPNLSPASTFAESSDNSHGSPDSEALKKSLHKSLGNDSLYNRVKAVSAALAHNSLTQISSNSKQIDQENNNNATSNSNLQLSQFTPILKNSNKLDAMLDGNSKSETSLTTTKDENFFIRNPIPVRYSSTTATSLTTPGTTTGGTTTTSSSADSTSQQYQKQFTHESNDLKAHFRRMSLDDVNKEEDDEQNRQLTNNFTVSSNNHLWKQNDINKSTNNKNNSLVPVSGVYHSQNQLNFNSSSDNKIDNNNNSNRLHALFAALNPTSLKDTAANFRRANTFNHNQVSPHTLQRTKSMLVVAHENQLSDITETCKQEMNLLLSLKDSEMVINV